MCVNTIPAEFVFLPCEELSSIRQVGVSHDEGVKLRNRLRKRALHFKILLQ